MSKLDPVIDEYRHQLGGLRDEAAQLTTQLAEKNNAIVILEAKIAGLEEAKQLVETKGRGKSSGDRKPRALSGPWKEILTHLALNGPIEFGYEELTLAARRGGHSDNRDNLRSQMSLYKTRGIVQPCAEGRFRLTKEAFKLLGLDYPYSDPSPSDDDDGPDFLPGNAQFAGSFDDDDLDRDVPF